MKFTKKKNIQIITKWRDDDRKQLFFNKHEYIFLLLNAL